MPENENLIHLLKLLDDESPVTRAALQREITALGSGLESALNQLPSPPTVEQRRQLRRLIDAVPGKPTGKPFFSPGRLVLHKRYGYRGVIVSVDPRCLAEEDWYRSNFTQPSRSQPWYHVLVHESDRVTYAAQTSLSPDPLTRRVVHPLISVYFADFKKGAYRRNRQPWPTGKSG